MCERYAVPLPVLHYIRLWQWQRQLYAVRVWHAESIAVLQHHHVSHGECEPYGEWQWHGLAEREQHPQRQRDGELYQLPHAHPQ